MAEEGKQEGCRECGVRQDKSTDTPGAASDCLHIFFQLY